MKFWFKGYKIFDEWTFFEQKKLTILTGTNNSGKSSLAQLLEILYHGFSESAKPNLHLNTRHYKLGNENSVYSYNGNGILQIAFEINDYLIIYKYHKSESGKKNFLELKSIVFFIYDSNNPFGEVDLENYKIIFDEDQVIYYLSKNGKEDINEYFNRKKQEATDSKIEKLNNNINELKNKLNNHIEVGGSKEDEEYKEIEKKLREKERELQKLQKVKRQKEISIHTFKTDFNIKERLKKSTQIIKNTIHIDVGSEFVDSYLTEKNDKRKITREDGINIIYYGIEVENEFKKEYYQSEAVNIYDLIAELFGEINNIKENVTANQLNYSSSLMKLRKRGFTETDLHIEFLRQINNFNDEELISFNTELQDILQVSDFFIDEFSIKVEVEEGVFYKLLINNKNIADFGDGFKNVLGIILPILLNEKKENQSKNQCYVLEEPEIRLHPEKQSKLADLFVKLSKKYDFIIETHSEYLIRKLQYLIAVNKISNDDVKLYYLQDKKLKEIEISENGVISEGFGKGFFDEAGKQIYKLLIKQNKNLKNKDA